MDEEGRRRLLRWYGAHGRDLPWRRRPDPYATWVSEAMLQQTRVEAAIPYFERWMARFPDIGSLAAAGEEEVLEAWMGLGYYSRARHLHRAARAIVQAGGRVRVPDDPDELRRLPGVGPYMAGAIASIAFGRRVPAIDGNAVRVVARLAGVRGDPARPAQRRRIERLAAAWVPADAPGDWNQAVMDLGATVCTPRAPRCAACPVAQDCAARRLGLAHRIPPPRRRPAPAAQTLHLAAVVRDGRLLVVRNPAGPLKGLWVLPGGGPPARLAATVRRQTGVRVRLGPQAGRARHSFTHRTWDMRVRRGRAAGGGGPQGPGPGALESRWLPLPGRAVLPVATRAALESVGL